MKTVLKPFLFSIFAALSVQGQVLLQDSTNYPYTNGSIESQGQWYAYYPKSPSNDAVISNNVLYLTATNHDEVATPSNGWNNGSEFTFASFSINVSQIPTNADGGYFCQFQNNGNSNNSCHIFIDTHDTVVPGTYRLGVANFSTAYGSAYPPINYPMDLAPGVSYTVVMLFDNNPYNETFAGSTLWVNPSEQDWINAENNDVIAPNIGEGYVYATDTPISGAGQFFTISQIAFQPYVYAGISNVIAGASFEAVNTTNFPTIGIQPQSQTNYSGNGASFDTVASGADVTYQWYSGSQGILTDGPNVSGSTSNILTVNNISASDTYYAVITDAYSHTTNTAIATNSVITTYTPVFFPGSVTAVNLTNTVFSTAAFTNVAQGTGPITYQWYFAPSNTPTTFSSLSGQTGSTLSLTLNDYTHAGYYYVVASSAANGGSVAHGPTNALIEIAPVNGSLSQLYALFLSMTNQIAANPTGTINVNTNNVTVSGYVTTYGGFGSSYSEFFIQDAFGYGIQVFLGGHGNTNTPAVGTYVTVTGPIVIYHAGLEIEPTSVASIVPGAAPVVPLTPKLESTNFNLLATNALNTNSLAIGASMVTFTNVYIYTNKTGGVLAPGQTFFANGFTALYFTEGGPYHVPDNTNVMEIYQFGYNYGNGVTSPFFSQQIPSHCYQLTGVYNPYGGFPEVEPSRLADYVVNPPSAFSTSFSVTNGGNTTLSWPTHTGSTYTVHSSTNLAGPWTTAAYGLTYYPSNGTFTDSNKTTAKFYYISTP